MENAKKNKVIKKKKKEILTHFDLGIYNGIKFELIIPTKHYKGNRNRHYIYYYFNGASKQFGAGIKETYLAYQDTLKENPRNEFEVLEDLRFLFKYDIETNILQNINKKDEVVKITLNTNVLSVIGQFYDYQDYLYQKGELDSLETYKARKAKLVEFFGQEAYKHMLLKDLKKDIWIEFQDYFLGQKLAKSSINSYTAYAGQMYNWLFTKEVQIFNHVQHTKRLDVSKQEKKYKLISPKLFEELYSILEANKLRYTRLYLAFLLIYENTLRPGQVCKIKLKNVDLDEMVISDIYNAKNKSYRSVEVSGKAVELIKIIINNTVSKGVNLNAEMYIIGGLNLLKSGIPNSPRSLREAFYLFLKEFPQFEDIHIYDNKKTSITKQFATKDLPPDEIRQRANHSKLSTTEIYNESAKRTKPFKIRITT